MPGLTERPLRYSPPFAAPLRMTSADHKVTKMQPSSHPLRSTVTDLFTVRPTTPTPTPDQARRENDYNDYLRGGCFVDSYVPKHRDNRSYCPHGGNRDHGPPAYERTYGHEGHFGGGRDRGSWCRTREPEADAGGYYDGYGGYEEYWREFDEYDGDRRDSAVEVQPQVPQQAGYYGATQPAPAYGQQYRPQPGYYRPLPAAAPSWPTAQREYQQQYHDPTATFGQKSFQPYYPQANYNQLQAYVPNIGYPYQQPSCAGFQQQHNLTQNWQAANNLNGNAPTFQSQLVFRSVPSGDANNKKTRPASTSASPAGKEHVLGYPAVTKKYLDNARQMVQTLDHPRQLLVVLDLNGTLLHRKQRGGASFVARPKVDEFIQYLLANHKVMVWSSAKPQNVQPMCKKLFSEEQFSQLVAVWARDTLCIPAHAYNQKVQVYKQLSWIWSDKGIQAKVPDASTGWDQSNTVLIDDSVEKAASEPHNLICLEEFENRPDQQESDVLGQVVKYLEMLKSEKDVSAFMQLMPFTYKAGEEFDWDQVA